MIHIIHLKVNLYVYKQCQPVEFSDTKNSNDCTSDWDASFKMQN